MPDSPRPGKDSLGSRPNQPPQTGNIQVEEFLGGLHHRYSRRAA